MSKSNISYNQGTDNSITKAEETGNEFVFNETMELNKKVDLKNYNIDEFNLFNTWLEKDPDHIRPKIKNKVLIMFYNEQWKVYNLYLSDQYRTPSKKEKDIAKYFCGWFDNEKTKELYVNDMLKFYYLLKLHHYSITNFNQKQSNLNDTNLDGGSIMGFSNFDDLLSNLEKTKKLSNKKNSNKKGKDKTKKSSSNLPQNNISNNIDEKSNQYNEEDLETNSTQSSIQLNLYNPKTDVNNKIDNLQITDIKLDHIDMNNLHINEDEDIDNNDDIRTIYTHESYKTINTYYTSITEDIFLNHTHHSKLRINERKIDENMMRKCLKYGLKHILNDGKVKFVLGDLSVIKADSKYETPIITAWKDFDGVVGDTLIGYVCDYYFTNRKGGYGFLKTEKGTIYFNLGKKSAKNLDLYGKVARFLVNKNDFGWIADNIEIID